MFVFEKLKELHFKLIQSLSVTFHSKNIVDGSFNYKNRLVKTQDVFMPFKMIKKIERSNKETTCERYKTLVWKTKEFFCSSVHKVSSWLSNTWHCEFYVFSL